MNTCDTWEFNSAKAKAMRLKAEANRWDARVCELLGDTVGVERHSALAGFMERSARVYDKWARQAPDAPKAEEPATGLKVGTCKVDCGCVSYCRDGLEPAPQPQARVERYGDGVLVHWPDGRTDQYIQVGDCVTGKVQPQAEPAAFFPNRLPDVDASDAPAHWYHKGWNDCRTQALHARAPQPQASRVELRGILDAIGEWQSGCSQGGPGECRHCSEALIEAIEAKAKRGLGVQS